MGIAERERIRRSSVVGTIAGIDKPKAKGRPKANREKKVRISLAIFPSLYKDVQKIAFVEKRSVSEIVANCLQKYIDENTEKIEEYNSLSDKL